MTGLRRNRRRYGGWRRPPPEHPGRGDRIFSAPNHAISACMPRWEPDARERLVVAALQLFSEQGYDETTVAVIADRAGLTKSTFHQSRAPRVAGSTRRASRAACSERQHHTDKGRHSAGSGHPTSRMSAADLLAAGRPRHEAAVLGSTSRPALSARDCRTVSASCWPEGTWTAFPTGWVLCGDGELAEGSAWEHRTRRTRRRSAVPIAVAVAVVAGLASRRLQLRLPPGHMVGLSVPGGYGMVPRSIPVAIVWHLSPGSGELFMAVGVS